MKPIYKFEQTPRDTAQFQPDKQAEKGKCKLRRVKSPQARPHLLTSARAV